jgi:membrane protease YdiL (CAAX protease family)
MLAFAAAAFAVLMASVLAWLSIILRAWSGARTQPLVPWRSRRPVPWAFIDLLLLVALWILASLVASSLLNEWKLAGGGAHAEAAEVAGPPRQFMLLGNVFISLAILALGLPLIGYRTGASFGDFGLTTRELAADLRLGLTGFVLLAPPVYALQGLLVKFWKPSQHPLVEMFKDAPDPLFFWLLFFSAAVVAPLFEEFIFRVVLQGYLEKWFAPQVTVRELFMGNDRQRPAAIEVLNEGPLGGEEVIQATIVEEPGSNDSAGAAPATGHKPATAAEDQPELRGDQAWLPIAISSGVFAALHYSHGPDWIPLLVLAAGMGYLYQRTHRLLPSLTVHCLLNSYSLWGLWIQVQNEAAKH